ncbi:MAG: hypothetical protein IKV55_04265, partial [Oscillospiraceae bacterium]|nr:hypothetical protein [Oscillospiraceae bacterium]
LWGRCCAQSCRKAPPSLLSQAKFKTVLKLLKLPTFNHFALNQTSFTHIMLDLGHFVKEKSPYLLTFLHFS